MATETTTADAPAADATPPAEGKEETAAGAPKVGRVVVFRERPARSAGGGTRQEAAATTSADSSASGAAASDLGSDATPTPEPPKPDAGRRALTLAMEKEAALVEQQRAYKAERAAWETQAKELQAEAELARAIRQAVKDGKRLKALELAGVSLDDVQDEYLASVREPTTEDLVEKAVATRLEAEKQRLADEAAARAKTEEETRSAQFNAQVTTWKDAAEKLYAEKQADYDPAAFDGVTADQIWERAVKEHKSTGKLPTAAETLALIQSDWDARLAKSKKFKPVEATPTAEKESTERTARDRTPRVITSKDAGSVPLRPKPAGRRETVLERLEKAKREFGVAD